MFGFTKPHVVTDDARIDEFLTRGIENIFPGKELLRSKLKEGKQMTFYYGIDPTGSSIHLGHVIPIKKLAQLQRLGHKVFFLIGDFTAMIGDPTDKMATRKPLTRDQVLNNARYYRKQVSKIISFSGANAARIKYNSEWLAKMKMEDVLKLMSHVTFAQTIKRDMFQKRIEEGKDLFLHEFTYPLMQGYDSVALNVDGEIGGNDQTFNMLVGRDLLKKLKNKEKYVIATKLLTDATGKKMGKTEGNMVNLNETPQEIFGKTMSWSDGLIIPAFELITDVLVSEIRQMQAEMERGANPRDYKIRLAGEIVSMIYGKEAAEKAHQSFVNTFKKGEIPEDAPQVLAEQGTYLKDVFVQNKVVSSHALWRRLVEGNAVTIMETNQTVKDPFTRVERSQTYRIGKKRFVKVVKK